MRRLYTRLFCSLLTVVLLLPACSNHPIESTVSGTIQNGNAPSVNNTEAPSVNNTEAPSVTIEGIPEVSSPGNDLVTYDPEREIYFSCENVNLDIYGDTSHCDFRFFIFSKKPLDVSQIEVRIPIESPYVFGIAENQFNRMTSYMAKENELDTNDTFPRNLFKAYCGMQFAEMGDLMCWLEDNVDQTHPDYVTKAMRYQELQAMYETEFQSLQPEDLPEIYRYEVAFFIPSKTRVNEVFRAIDIVIDGAVYHQEIGVVRLMTERTPLDYPVGEYMGVFAWGRNLTVYTDGMDAITLYNVTLKEDAVLHRLHVVNEDVEIAAVRLWVDGIAVDWDGNEPLQVYAGERITVQAVYKSTFFENLFHNMIVYFELDAMIDGEMQAWPAQVHNDCYHANPYLVNAIVFDGLDVSSMFRDYTYRSAGSWQYHFPELRDSK